jgi:hypothetical protein
MRKKAIFLLEWRTWRCRRLRTNYWVPTRRGERLSVRLELGADIRWMEVGGRDE